MRFVTFNMEYGGENYDLRVAVVLFEKLQPDVIFVCEGWRRSKEKETKKKKETKKETKKEKEKKTKKEKKKEKEKNGARALAQKLNFHYVGHRESETAILVSPLHHFTPIKSAKLPFAAALVDKKYCCVSVHLWDWEYQPFQALGIPYCISKNICQRSFVEAKELIQAAKESRQKEIKLLLNFISNFSKIKNKKTGVVVVIGGDMNEPSYLDWTDKMVARGYSPVAVEFPTSKMLTEQGKLYDTFRTIYCNPVLSPGYTWPTIQTQEKNVKVKKKDKTDKKDKKDKKIKENKSRADRIDFIYCSNKKIIKNSAVESNSPSDHALVITDLR